jgi:hypothetical protein
MPQSTLFYNHLLSTKQCVGYLPGPLELWRKKVLVS